jgi:CRISPR/Cas system CSM-associated protein Csm2 small subunit
MEKEILEAADKSLYEHGFFKKPNGECIYDLKTEFGKVIYMFNIEAMEGLFGRLAFDFLAKLEGLPTTIEEIKERYGIPDETHIDATFELPEDVKEEVEKAGEYGITYFMDNLAEIFLETFTRVVEETFCRALLSRAGEGYYIFNKTESVVFDEFIKAHGKELKKRMKIRKATGPKVKWTDETNEEMYEFYESLKATIQKAKKQYRQYTKDGNKNWQKDIENNFPSLDPQIIKQFGQKDKESEPWMLARRIVASQYGKDDSEGEYIKTLLKQVRASKKNAKQN